MDVLSEILRVATVHTSIDGPLELPPARSAQMGAAGQAPFFLVTSGSCLVEDEHGVRSEEFVAGDFLILGQPHGQSLTVPPGAKAKLLAGGFHFDATAEHPLSRVLPSRLVLRSTTCDHARWLTTALELVATEAGSMRPGWEVVTNRLADVLLVQALRTQVSATTGWLRGLADPEISQVLRLMHLHPARAWTVAGLAARLDMSRSAFAERFHIVVGQPPLTYLTWWRMHSAAAMLRSNREITVAHAARAVGYETEAAFGKAFKRILGKTPGNVRREAQSIGKRPASPLQRELKKRTPFEVPEQEAGLNLRRTSAQFEADFGALFRVHGLSPVMYNVLRILRGTGTPLTSDEIASQMLVTHPDVNQLLAEIDSAGYLQRAPQSRTGPTRHSITPQGLEILNDLDRPVIQLHRRQLAHFTPEEMATFNRLLVKARSPGTSENL